MGRDVANNPSFSRPPLLPTGRGCAEFSSGAAYELPKTGLKLDCFLCTESVVDMTTRDMERHACPTVYTSEYYSGLSDVRRQLGTCNSPPADFHLSFISPHPFQVPPFQLNSDPGSPEPCSAPYSPNPSHSFDDILPNPSHFPTICSQSLSFNSTTLFPNPPHCPNTVFLQSLSFIRHHLLVIPRIHPTTCPPNPSPSFNTIFSQSLLSTYPNPGRLFRGLLSEPKIVVKVSVDAHIG